jgi:hypothetical protein
MGQVLHFPNLKVSNERSNATGTKVTDASAVDHACLDVFARNDASNPLYVSAGAGFNLLGQDIHDASSANINDSGGAYVALGAGTTVPAGTDYVQVSSTLGEPVVISFAANLAGAAASVLKIYLVPGGAPGKMDFVPGSSNKAFIKSLSANAITEGYVTLNFIG